MFCLCWYLSSTHFTAQYRKLCGTPSLCLPHSYSRGLWLLGCGYSQKGAVVAFCDSVIPFRLPAPKGLIIFNVFSLKSSMSGKKCPALNYTHPLMWTCLEGLLLGFLSSVNLTSTFYNITFIPWAACVTTWGYGLCSWHTGPILLLTATFIPDSISNRLEAHAGLFQFFFLVLSDPFLALLSLHILVLAQCLW